MNDRQRVDRALKALLPIPGKLRKRRAAGSSMIESDSLVVAIEAAVRHLTNAAVTLEMIADRRARRKEGL